ncbi:MAG: insulinase family protein [Oscillospiraceae bacterium]|nr:insulinase family protein [Oscillospiraceae bacterium]
MEKAIIRTIMPGVDLIYVHTDKFKTGHLSVNFMLQLSKADAAKNALVMHVLRRGCKRLPDLQSISEELDRLYGATVDPFVRTIGEVQCIGLSANFADDRYLPGHEDILEKTVNLTAEILLDPATKGGLLRSDYVRSERDNLCDAIRSDMSDKRTYSFLRLKELMFAGEAYGTDRNGTLKTAEKIAQIALTKHYKNILSTAPVKMFYCGGADEERITQALLNAFSTLPRGEIDFSAGTDVRVECGEPRFFSEAMDVTQGKLTMGFRLGEVMYAPDYAAIAVFNAVFGGGVTSKLFMNVRERLSLCYYASSSTDRFKGVMFVMSGVESDKYETARDEILAQLAACADGDISDGELSSAINFLVNSVRAMEDSVASLDAYYVSRSLDGLTYAPSEYAMLIGEITREDVVKVAKSVKLDSVYFLRGTDKEGE